LYAAVTGAHAQLIGEWRLNGSSWTGAADEVLDGSGGNHHGRVIVSTLADSSAPVRSGNPGTCGYATQRRGAIQIKRLPVSTKRGAKTTVTFWMKWDGTDNVMPIGWGSHDLWMIHGSMGCKTFNHDVYGVSSSGLARAWHHIAAEFTNGDVHKNRLFIDGAERPLTQRRGRPKDSRGYVQSEF
jgi:MSHA biogenesis protein MshQ